MNDIPSTTSVTAAIATASESVYRDGQAENGANGEMTTDTLKRLEEEIAAKERSAYERGLTDGYAKGYDAAREEMRQYLSKPGARPRPAEIKQERVKSGPKPLGIPRGATMVLVEQALETIAPNATSPFQIIQMVQEKKKVKLAETSVRRALDGLVAKGTVEQVGTTKTWRYIAEGVSEERLKEYGVIPIHAKLKG
jgi:hypothetical protein